MISGRRVFITGGAGFIANRLINELVERNQITVYDNFARDTLSKSAYAEDPRIRVITGDVLDFGHLRDAMSGHDTVIHAAAIAGIDTVVKSPVQTMRVNMIGTANALEAARLCGVAERFVDFSTSEVFGAFAFRSNEEESTVAGSAGEARWTYAVSKLASEHLAHAYFTEFSLPVVTVRPFNVYGPGQTGEGAFQIFVRKALANETIEIDGDGSQIRAWCFVDDFVDGLMRAIESPYAIGKIFNIGNARAVITVLGLAQTICRVLDSSSRVVHVDPLSVDVAIRVPDVTRASEILGFTAKVDLEEGIRQTAEWMLSQQP